MQTWYVNLKEHIAAKCPGVWINICSSCARTNDLWIFYITVYLLWLNLMIE